ncbi:MAG: hypothetical protein IJP96_07880 [Synergistaceae bacterium]|nr:hypothetical protein [Synergistaceae bacterium]MBR0075655.1 hypothetical protein [Synergistaceae bacterium]
MDFDFDVDCDWSELDKFFSEFNEGLKDIKLYDYDDGFKELDKILSELNEPIPELDKLLAG